MTSRKNKKRSNNKKKNNKNKFRDNVNVVPTKASDALEARKKQLNDELVDLQQQIENNESKQSDCEQPSEISNEEEHDIIEDINEEEIAINAIFDTLKQDDKYDEDHFDIFEEVQIDAKKLIYLLKSDIAACLNIFPALTKQKWDATHIIGLKMEFDARQKNTNTNKKQNDTNCNNSNSKKISVSPTKNNKIEFKMKYDESAPDFKQFMPLYDEPNKYIIMSIPKKIYRKKAYFYAVSLIYCINKRKAIIESGDNKDKNIKIPLIKLVTCANTTVYFRKIHWSAMLFIYDIYCKTAADPEKFQKDICIPLFQTELSKVYAKYKTKKNKYKFKWEPEFVKDAFDTIGDIWTFISTMKATSSKKDQQKPINKKRGRRTRISGL
eukprot:265078_1